MSCNTITDSHIGVYLREMGDVTMQDNLFRNNDEAVVVEKSTIFAAGNVYEGNGANFVTMSSKVDYFCSQVLI